MPLTPAGKAQVDNICGIGAERSAPVTYQEGFP
jgi:hypothetical protein